MTSGKSYEEIKNEMKRWKKIARDKKNAKEEKEKAEMLRKIEQYKQYVKEAEEEEKREEEKRKREAKVNCMDGYKSVLKQVLTDSDDSSVEETDKENKGGENTTNKKQGKLKDRLSLQRKEVETEFQRAIWRLQKRKRREEDEKDEEEDEKRKWYRTRGRLNMLKIKRRKILLEKNRRLKELKEQQKNKPLDNPEFSTEESEGEEVTTRKESEIKKAATNDKMSDEITGVPASSKELTQKIMDKEKGPEKELEREQELVKELEKELEKEMDKQRRKEEEAEMRYTILTQIPRREEEQSDESTEMIESSGEKEEEKKKE